MSKVNGPPLARRGIWAYPWDLVDRAAGDPLGGILAAGLESVSIATIYHPVQALLPANPRRIWFADDAGAYYDAAPLRQLLRLRPPFSVLDSDGEQGVAVMVVPRIVGESPSSTYHREAVIAEVCSQEAARVRRARTFA